MNKKAIIAIVSVVCVAAVLGVLFASGVIKTSANNETDKRSQTEQVDVTISDGPDTPTETSFRKQDMPNVTHTINGDETEFSYVKSVSYKMPVERNLDGEQLFIVYDHYASDKGYSLIEYEKTGEIKTFSKNDFKEKNGEKISQDAAVGIARSVIKNSDIDFVADEADVNVNDDGINRYYVFLTSDSGTVQVTVDYTGEFTSISVTKDVSSEIGKERKEAAIAKIEQKMKKLEEEERSNGFEEARFEVSRMVFEKCGDDVIAYFDLLFYPRPGLDGGSGYDYHCRV